MTKKIKTGNADAGTVMAAIARAAASTGFSLQPHDATTATAHDGGKPVSGNVAATRARVGVRIEPGRVLLDSQTTGAAYAGAGNPFFTARINSRYAKFAKRVKREVQSSR